MSQMSHLRLSQSKRMEIIKQELPKGTTQEEIARLCGVTRRTVARDIQKWKADGGFEKWLQVEFFKLHNEIKEGEPSQAYRVVARLLERTLTRKVEANLKGSTNLVVRISPGLEGRPKEDSE